MADLQRSFNGCSLMNFQAINNKKRNENTVLGTMAFMKLLCAYDKEHFEKFSTIFCYKPVITAYIYDLSRDVMKINLDDKYTKRFRFKRNDIQSIVGTINEWACTISNNKKKDLVDEKKLIADFKLNYNLKSRLMIKSKLDEKWIEPFHKSKTKFDKFHSNTGMVIKMPFLHSNTMNISRSTLEDKHKADIILLKCQKGISMMLYMRRDRFKIPDSVITKLIKNDEFHNILTLLRPRDFLFTVVTK